MKAYLQAFAFKTVSSEQFKEFFTNHFEDNAAGDTAAQIRGTPGAQI